MSLALIPSCTGDYLPRPVHNPYYALSLDPAGESTLLYVIRGVHGMVIGARADRTSAVTSARILIGLERSEKG
jgi:hypothetical protein